MEGKAKTERVDSEASGLVRESIAFFLVSCILSWSAMMLSDVPENAQVEDPEAVGDTLERVSLFYAFGPFISAIGLTLYRRGRFAIKSLLRPILKWRVAFVWYACALAIPIIAQWLALVLWRSWTGYGVKLPPPADAAQTWLVATPPIAAFTITEETGWRGSALPRLQSCSKALSASLVLGVCWSFWHYPLEIAIGRASGESAKAILLSLTLFTASTTLFSVLMTWVFNSSRGSLLLILLMHGSNNASLFIVVGAMDQGGNMDLTFRVFYMLSLLSLVSLVLLQYGTKCISKSYKITFESLR